MRCASLTESSSVRSEFSSHKYGLRILTRSIPENTLFEHFETRGVVLVLNPRFTSKDFAWIFSVALVRYFAHPICTMSSLFRCSPN